MSQSEFRSFLSHGMAKWGLFIVALFALWFAGWFIAADYADDKVTETLEQLDRQGIKIACANQDIRGFPFRLGLHCASVDVVDARSGTKLTSGGLNTAAQLYAPGKMIGELDGPLSLVQTGQAVAASWSRMRVFLDANFEGGFDIASLNFADLDAQVEGHLLRVEEGSLHLRPAPEDQENAAAKALDLAVDLKQVEQKGSFSNALPKLSFYLDAQLEEGYRDLVVARLPIDAVLRDGASGLVRSLSVSVADGGKLAINGPLQLGPDGLLSGDLQIGMANPETVAKAFSAVDPVISDFLLNLGNALNMMGKPAQFGGEEIRAVPVKIERGEVKLGFIRIGTIPPIRF